VTGREKKGSCDVGHTAKNVANPHKTEGGKKFNDHPQGEREENFSRFLGGVLPLSERDLLTFREKISGKQFTESLYYLSKGERG